MLKIYRSLIPQDIQILLAKASQSHSEAQWIIGVAALDIYEFITKSHEEGKMKMITTEQGFAAVGHYADTSGLRVRKIARVVGLFEKVREQHPDLTFGYFERAYDFGEDEGNKFLEFCEGYELDKGKQTFNTLTFVFRKNILGEEVENEEPKEIPYNPPDPWEEWWRGDGDSSGKEVHQNGLDIWVQLHRIVDKVLVITPHLADSDRKERLVNALTTIKEDLESEALLESMEHPVPQHPDQQKHS